MTYGIHMILSSDSVRDKEIDHICRCQTSIVETGDQLVGGVVRFGNKKVRRRLRHVGTASQESKTRASCTVGNTNGTSELNARLSQNVSSVLHLRLASKRVLTSHRRTQGGAEQRDAVPQRSHPHQCLRDRPSRSGTRP